MHGTTIKGGTDQSGFGFEFSNPFFHTWDALVPTFGAAGQMAVKLGRKTRHFISFHFEASAI
jgi:hypothetical protein